MRSKSRLFQGISKIAKAMVFIASLASSSLVYAEIQILTATHIYAMGDNDSRNDARRLCFLEAKRKVLEMAGVYIQSHDVVTNSELTRSQIISYSAAVLSVETVQEEFSSTNGQLLLTMKVRAAVDTDDVRKRFQMIMEDKQLQDKVARQQDQLRELEAQLRRLSVKLNAAPMDSSAELKKERNILIGDIDELEKKENGSKPQNSGGRREGTRIN